MTKHDAYVSQARLRSRDEEKRTAPSRIADSSVTAFLDLIDVLKTRLRPPREVAGTLTADDIRLRLKLESFTDFRRRTGAGKTTELLCEALADAANGMSCGFASRRQYLASRASVLAQEMARASGLQVTQASQTRLIFASGGEINFLHPVAAHSAFGLRLDKVLAD